MRRINVLKQQQIYEQNYMLASNGVFNTTIFALICNSFSKVINPTDVLAKTLLGNEKETDWLVQRCCLLKTEESARIR